VLGGWILRGVLCEMAVQGEEVGGVSREGGEFCVDISSDV